MSRSGFSRAFTIVELLIVVVVIAILAAITIVAYSGIQKQAVRASVQSSLTNASTAIKLEAVKSSSGFTSIPSNVRPSDNVGLALTVVAPPASSDTSFCMNGTYVGHNDVAYHTTEAGNIEEGLCEGDVLPDTVVGSYNYEAGGATPEDLGYTPITAGSSSAELYGFKVTTNPEWTSVTLSWDPQPGAVRYEVQTRVYGSTSWGGWGYRMTATGGNNCSGSPSPSCSNGIPPSTNSLAWTDTAFSVPSVAGKRYQYQIRPCDSSSCGSWTIASLDNPVQGIDRVPEVRNFTVAPSTDWSSVNISWSSAQPYATAMGSTARYEVQTRVYGSTSWGGWGYRMTATGGNNCSGNPSPTCSNGVPRTTTSYTWTDTTFSVPSSAGKKNEYRIRNCVTGHTTYCGEWSTAALDNPIQNSSDVPAVTGFTVTPAGDWSNVALSWNSAPNYAKNMSETRFEIQTRVYGSTSWGGWGYRMTATGGNNCSGNPSPTCSNGVPRTTTSYTWTDTTFSVPSAPGKRHGYQIRNCVTGYSTFCGPWSGQELIR